MEIINLPKTGPKYLGFVQGELVVLKPRFDDKNYKRIYEVIENQGGKLTVEVKVENAINSDKYSQGHNKDESSVGQIFTGMDSSYFTPFM